ncbi:MAG: radical SAM/SPASM domain-containing protein [bacterium]|nr:radical SAM/SPASM domain-containing protein [bacterium]
MNSHPEYGFQDHLSAEFPSQIVVDVTERCNLACIHCPHEAFTQSEVYAGRHLSLELNRKLVDEIATDGKGYCQYLRYTAQGEPLLNPHFIEMVQYAGKYAGVALNVTSNGKALTPEKASALLDAGVGTFDISIDAYSPEVYAQIRKKGNLVETKPNILNLIKARDQGGYQAKVVVSYIEQPLNQGETELFESYWKEVGADFVVIRRLHSCAGAKPDIAEQMKQNSAPRKPCLYPWERLVLSPTGDVAFCPAEWRYEAKIISFAEQSIQEIWKGPFMQSLRKAHLENQFADHPYCGNCPDWMATRWPWEGRAYADMMRDFANQTKS